MDLDLSRYAGVLQSGGELYPVGKYIQEEGEAIEHGRAASEEEILEEFGIERDDLILQAINDESLRLIEDDESRKYAAPNSLPQYVGDMYQEINSASD